MIEMSSKGIGDASKVTPMLLLSIFASVIGSGLTMGYNLTLMNNPQAFIQSFIRESHSDQTGELWSSSATQNMFAFIASVYSIGAALGAMAGPTIASKIGRKTFLLLNNIVMMVGVLLSSWSVYFNAYQMLLVGRIFAGMNNGANTTVCPIYLSEIAPKEVRGAAGTCFQLSVATGIFLADVLSFETILGGRNTWPELFNVILVFGLVQSSLLPFCPESPQFLLVSTGFPDAPIWALKSLRGNKMNIGEELKELEEDYKRQVSEPPIGWIELFSTGYIRRPLLIAVVTSISQQLSGVNGIFVYSAPIFEAATGGSADLVNVLVAGTGLVGIVGCVLAIGAMDRLGRKALMLTGLGGMAICSVVIALLLSDIPTDSSDSCNGVRFGQWSDTVACVMIFVYIGFFSIGPSSIPFLIAPELFSNAARPKAVSVCLLANWAGNFSVTYLFPLVQEQICGWVFMIFAGLLLTFCLFLWWKFPEVAGLSTREITDLFRSKDRDENWPMISITSH